MNELVSVIMDGLILLFLAGTIFFAIKLSKALREFKENRTGIEKLIQELSTQITHAENVIGNMRQASKDAGRDLQELIDDAVAFRDELSLMNDTADRLAGRLEQSIDHSSKGRRGGITAQPADSDHDEDSNSEDSDEGHIAHFDDGKDKPRQRLNTTKDVIEENFPAFVIRDPEFDADGAALDDLDDEEEDFPDDEDFYSEAERDLYEALVQSKAKKGSGA